VLIDLAGSERASATGANSGEIKDADKRFKEGVKINQSLTSLMRVIQILAKKCADEAAGKKSKDVVPYRDSALT
jgi:kinesin family protein 16B